jgi:TfoX/Sxy family transcriptional regulator of competence genes
MAYDTDLAKRIRELVAHRKGVTEKAMFGGLAFLLDGKMFCGVLASELLARVGPDAHDAAMARPHVRIMDFTGRPMRGYVFVEPEAISTNAELSRWVSDCAAHAATLPDRPRKKRTLAAKPRETAPRRRGPSRQSRASGRRA